MRWLPLLLLLPLCSATMWDGPAIDWERIDAVHAGMAYLADEPASYLTLEAVAAARLDVATWPEGEPLLGTISIPAPVGPAGGPIRLVGAAAALGYNPRAFPTPEGPVDLLQMTRDNHGAVLNSSSVAATAFHLSALRSAGEPEESSLMGEAIARLRAAQNSDGGWPCAGTQSNIDCTGFVAVALGDQLDEEARGRAVEFIQAHNVGRGYGASLDAMEANTQSTAWALTALRQWQSEYDAHDDARAFLFEMQQDDGSFHLTPGEPGVAVWVTAEVVRNLAWSHPLPRHMPMAVEVPAAHASAGDVLQYSIAPELGQWTWQGESHVGTSTNLTVPEQGAWLSVYVAEGNAVYRERWFVGPTTETNEAPALPLAFVLACLWVAQRPYRR